MAVGNKHLGYKEALNAIEAGSPGAKHAFYFGFLDRAAAHFRGEAVADQEELHPCPRCGSPTTAEVCAFCKLVDRAGGRRPSDGPVIVEGPVLAEEPVPVELGATRHATVQAPR